MDFLHFSMEVVGLQCSIPLEFPEVFKNTVVISLWGFGVPCPNSLSLTERDF
jgi:hypothetical protein